MNVDTREELLDGILGAAAGGSIKKRQGQLRRTARDLSTRVAKCSEVVVGILERLVRAVTSVSVLCCETSQ